MEPADSRNFLTSAESRYKMIRAIDFYEFVHARLTENPNFRFLNAEIETVGNGTVTTNWVHLPPTRHFDSFSRSDYNNPKYQNLWQHFKGWTIETAQAKFDPTP